MEPFLAVTLILLWLVMLFQLILMLGLVRKVNRLSVTGLAAAPSSASKQEDYSGLKPGEKAPNFIAHTLDGEEVSLATYTNRPTAFIFFEPGCPICADMLPGVLELEPAAAHSGVHFVLVSAKEAEETRTWAEGFNVTIPLLVAPLDSNPFVRDFRAAAPSYCLLDEQGNVLASGLPSRYTGTWKELASSWMLAIK